MRTLERVVLVIGSVIAMVGAFGIMWRELSIESHLPAGGWLRRTFEIIVPAACLAGLIVWLWVR